MIRKSKMVVFSLALFFVAGCSVNRAVNKKLSPPSDTQWVNVEVKNPSPHTKPFPLEVRYISHKCIKKRISGFDGSVITEPSYNVIDIPMQQQKGDNWKAKVPMTGGGSCQWSLSAINLGIEYIEATHLGKDLVPGTAVGATIAFDNDAAWDGRFVPSTGDLRMSPKYYPYIIERKIGENTKSLSLPGKESFLTYRAFMLSNVYFCPEIDEGKIVRYIGPEKKVEGVYAKIIYPDGTVAPERTLFPDFDEIDKMRVK